MLRNGKLLAIAGCLVIGLGAATASAGSITFGASDSDYRVESGGDGGGEFVVTAYTDSALLPTPGHSPKSGAVFHTFCVERLNQQHISLPGGPYNYVISTHSSAWNAGDGSPTAVGTGTETTRELDIRTAYLYTQFYHGTLGNDTATTSDDYDYTAGSARADDALALQRAIWYFQTSTGTYGEQWSSLAAGSLELAYVNMANQAVTDGWSTIGNVRILQLTDATDGHTRQDQLTMVPLPPAALAGLALLGGLGLLRLRRRRNALI